MLNTAYLLFISSIAPLFRINLFDDVIPFIAYNLMYGYSYCQTKVNRLLRSTHTEKNRVEIYYDNYIIVNHLSNKLCIPLHGIEQSNIALIGCELCLYKNDVKVAEYSVHMKPYYVVGNVIDKTFVKYFVEHVQSNKCDYNRYVMKFMDMNDGLKNVEFTDNDKLIILKNGYDICKVNE